MPVVADTLTAIQRSQLGRIAEPPPEPTWRGKPTSRCDVCGHWFGAPLKTVHGPAGSSTQLCRRCMGAHVG